MKKLAALFMAVMLLLCAVAQAETKVVDLTKDADEYFHSGMNGLLIPVDGDTVITGETNYPVFLGHTSGVITLDNVRVNEGTNSMLVIASEASMVEVKLKGVNELIGGSGLGAMLGQTSLRFTDGGSGVLMASGPVGMQVLGDIIVDGGRITAIGSHGSSFAGIYTLNGTLTVNGGDLRAFCFGEDGNEVSGAYLNVDARLEDLNGEPEMSLFKPGKVIAGSGYIIETGDTPVSMTETGAYNGEMCLEVYAPELPETGDGANLAMWTAMLAMSVIGILAMRRKAY